MFKKFILDLSFVKDREKELNIQILELRTKNVSIESSLYAQREIENKLLVAEGRCIELIQQMEQAKVELAMQKDALGKANAAWTDIDKECQVLKDNLAL